MLVSPFRWPLPIESTSKFHKKQQLPRVLATKLPGSKQNCRVLLQLNPRIILAATSQLYLFGCPGRRPKESGRLQVLEQTERIYILIPHMLEV